MVVACGSSQPEPASPQELVTHQAGDKPPLVVVQRSGDPHVALAVAVWLPGGATALPSLGTTLEAAMRGQGFAPTGRLGVDALIVSVELPAASAAPQALAAIHEGLLRAPLQAAPSAPVAVDPCAAAGTDKDAAQLRAALGHDNVALAVVGPEQAVAEVTDAYHAAPAWPSGQTSAEPWPERDLFRAERQARGQRLLLALRVPDAARALGTARRLSAPDSSLNWLVRASSPRWHLDRVTASLRPAGACLLAEMNSPVATGVRPAARLAKAARAEMLKRLQAAQPSSPELLPLEAPRAQDAASRAAWAALSGRYEAGPVHSQAVLFSEAPDLVSFEREMRAAQAPKLAPVSAVEAGQGRLWALLTSACPTAHEEMTTAGHTAAALATAARFATRDEPSAIVAPWAGQFDLGLVASLPAHDDGAAARLGELMGRALLAASSDAALVSDTRALLAVAEPPTPAWELALRLASDGHPSQLLPRGLGSAGNDFDVIRARDALRGFVDGRLRLAVLSNHNPQQATELAERLSELLSPLGPSSNACPKPAKPPRVGGEYLLEQEEAEALLIFPLDADQLASARVAEVLLGGAGGWLERAVLDTGLARHAEAHALGVPNQRAALVIALSDEMERLGPAVMQVRALIDRLRTTRISPATLKRAVAALDVHQDLADPAHRLARLAQPKGKSPTPSQIERFFSEQLSESRLIVVRPVPPSPQAP